MKRHSFLVVGILIAGSVVAGGKQAVQVRAAKLRSSPQFLAPIVATLEYGATIEELEENGSWIKVRTSGGTMGWLHETSLGKARAVTAGAGKAETTASGHEVSLAGKGFNEQVEKEYAGSHKELDFTKVDALERLTASEAEIKTFAVEGGLLKGGA
ncbi:SH3 domain-containing protein [bacterium]|nr:SH3 domain-containing protein [candidate division CSSED10-310 bacterium]